MLIFWAEEPEGFRVIAPKHTGVKVTVTPNPTQVQILQYKVNDVWAFCMLK